MRIASPSADINDVKGMIQKGEQGSQLREWKGILQVDRIGCKRAWRKQSSETEVDVLHHA